MDFQYCIYKVKRLIKCIFFCQWYRRNHTFWTQQSRCYILHLKI